jgi:hypothetical protein
MPVSIEVLGIDRLSALALHDAQGHQTVAK